MKPISIRSLAAIVACVSFALVLVGCGGSSGGSSSGGTTDGTVRVVMVDAQDPGITAVSVIIDRVEAHINNDWVTLTTTPQTFNLFDLVKNEAILASTNIPAGHYTQIRFFPSSGTVTDATGTHNLTIPSGVQTGVKVNVDFDINANQITTILLDFNVNKSIIKTGNGKYMMQPVIPAVVKILSGTVTGIVTRLGAVLKGATITATYSSGANYPIGTQVNTATSLADGSFKIWALLPGTYLITASFVDPATNLTTSAGKAGVVVTANQNTDVGVIALP